MTGDVFPDQRPAATRPATTRVEGPLGSTAGEVAETFVRHGTMLIVALVNARHYPEVVAATELVLAAAKLREKLERP